MKKLLTILAIATLIGCSKENECECFSVKYRGAHSFTTDNPTGISIYDAVSLCSGEQITIESNDWLSTPNGTHCFDEPLKY